MIQFFSKLRSLSTIHTSKEKVKSTHMSHLHNPMHEVMICTMSEIVAKRLQHNSLDVISSVLHLTLQNNKFHPIVYYCKPDISMDALHQVSILTNKIFEIETGKSKYDNMVIIVIIVMTLKCIRRRWNN